MSRLPIRLRLALAFALAMAVMLAATGAFLYLRLASSLDETIDEELDARAGSVGALVAGGAAGLESLAAGGLDDQEERFAQVIDRQGRIVAATPIVGGRPLLAAHQVAVVIGGDTVRAERTEIPEVGGHVRLLAVPDGDLVLVVGVSLDERDESLRGFLGELLIVGPVALVLASLLGYGVATAALRPVESMRAEAAAISGADPGRRLTTPRSRDEIARLCETLNEMLDRLEAALEHERAFVADASHELRTPLALLEAELELALRRPRSPEELEAALRSAAAETDRLVRLAEDLLALARSDQGKLSLHPAPISARGVLTGVAERFALRARAEGRELVVDASAGVDVLADGPRLEQALGNLVDNALRHGRGEVRLSAVERDGSIELHVEDHGAGFPPEFLPRAFERFARADEARSGEGAGLGMAIAGVIATSHGGSAHAANRDHGGADVWISIPRP
jgi:signal transduction histidine kinase